MDVITYIKIIEYGISKVNNGPEDYNTLGYFHFQSPFSGALTAGLIVVGGTTTLTCRRIMYVTTSTPIYLITLFNGGNSNNTAVLNTPSYLRYTRIA